MVKSTDIIATLLIVDGILSITIPQTGNDPAFQIGRLLRIGAGFLLFTV